ncbi:hypothetical protein P152DRAFT_23973 [Eremomyces bilateralis CBS 781.70]|uniref:C2H2-type domain-containing protein n=1 Tax=Eremomyces bilateralis CBS 781.70 TaxID=1392243 RepID=A0A6G1GI75_9PEZI|nr:uncharacterized protein P152DRAFT_23973 [Eremomyces bilateralis CBS 781.70]KAF1817601.1 hypothetical protein P152DRAFT_23973 [Eremomyces bilateralis CBS 781.70]
MSIPENSSRMGISPAPYTNHTSQQFYPHVANSFPSADFEEISVQDFTSHHNPSIYGSSALSRYQFDLGPWNSLQQQQEYAVSTISAPQTYGESLTPHDVFPRAQLLSPNQRARSSSSSEKGGSSYVSGQYQDTSATTELSGGQDEVQSQYPDLDEGLGNRKTGAEPSEMNQEKASARPPSTTGTRRTSYRRSVPKNCEICSRPCNNQSEYTKHMQKHQKPFKCELCGRSEGYSTKNDLARHQKTKHGIEDGRGYWYCPAKNCNKRNKPWPRWDNFKNHVKKIHDDQDVDELLERFVFLDIQSTTFR